MQTVKALKRAGLSVRAGIVQRRGVRWLLRNQSIVTSWAADAGIDIADAMADDLASVPPILPPVAVVIPCHNYGRYLTECLQSVTESKVRPSQILVIDDSSDADNAQQIRDICQRFGVQRLRVEVGNVHEVRRIGLAELSTETAFVLFLDADNTIDPEYLGHCVTRLSKDPDAALCYPVLQSFGDATGPRYGTQNSPLIVRSDDIELRNWCDAGSVYRVDALKQSQALELPATAITEDWMMARRVLRSGVWHGLRSDVPLNYRVHGKQKSQEKNTFFDLSCAAHELVTIVIAFSGRWPQWEKLREWLLSQSWPNNQTRLLVMDSSHQRVTAEDLGLEQARFAGLQIERIDVGKAQLADADRTKNTTFRDVETAVSAIYNRALQLVPAEWILFVEDDVIPQQPDTIERLIRRVDWNVACVSGLYRHRYHESAVAYKSFAANGRTQLLKMTGPDCEPVIGTGFGCLLARRSVLRRYALSGATGAQPHYDVSVSRRINASGLKWLLDRTVDCVHLTSLVPK